MRLFVGNIGNAVRYALSNRKGIIVICALMAITSIAPTNQHLNSFWRILTVTLLIVMGYGPYVSWYALKNQMNIQRLTT